MFHNIMDDRKSLNMSALRRSSPRRAMEVWERFFPFEDKTFKYIDLRVMQWALQSKPIQKEKRDGSSSKSEALFGTLFTWLRSTLSQRHKPGKILVDDSKEEEQEQAILLCLAYVEWKQKLVPVVDKADLETLHVSSPLRAYLTRVLTLRATESTSTFTRAQVLGDVYQSQPRPPFVTKHIEVLRAERPEQERLSADAIRRRVEFYIELKPRVRSRIWEETVLHPIEKGKQLLSADAYLPEHAVWYDDWKNPHSEVYQRVQSRECNTKEGQQRFEARLRYVQWLGGVMEHRCVLRTNYPERMHGRFYVHGTITGLESHLGSYAKQLKANLPDVMLDPIMNTSSRRVFAPYVGLHAVKCVEPKHTSLATLETSFSELAGACDLPDKSRTFNVKVLWNLFQCVDHVTHPCAPIIGPLPKDDRIHTAFPTLFKYLTLVKQCTKSKPFDTVPNAKRAVYVPGIDKFQPRHLVYQDAIEQTGSGKRGKIQLYRNGSLWINDDQVRTGGLVVACSTAGTDIYTLEHDEKKQLLPRVRNLQGQVVRSSAPFVWDMPDSMDIRVLPAFEYKTKTWYVCCMYMQIEEKENKYHCLLRSVQVNANPSVSKDTWKEYKMADWPHAFPPSRMFFDKNDRLLLLSTLTYFDYATRVDLSRGILESLFTSANDIVYMDASKQYFVYDNSIWSTNTPQERLSGLSAGQQVMKAPLGAALSYAWYEPRTRELKAAWTDGTVQSVSVDDGPSRIPST